MPKRFYLILAGTIGGIGFGLLAAILVLPLFFAFHTEGGWDMWKRWLQVVWFFTQGLGTLGLLWGCMCVNQKAGRS